MRRLLSILVLGVMPLGVLAQDWTPEQLAVIEDMESCWDAWLTAFDSANPAPWAAQCLATDYAVWYAGWDGGFWTPRDWHRNLSNQGFGSGTTYLRLSLRPLRVDVDGDLALVYYSPVWVKEDKEGDITNPSQRRLEVQQRVDGKWKFRGGMGVQIAED